ncbi:MAG: SBBP repeat-containing protein [Candidatus Binatia bacterium]
MGLNRFLLQLSTLLAGITLLSSACVAPGGRQPLASLTAPQRNTVSPHPDPSASNPPSPAYKTYGQIPLSFEANTGQTNERVKFLSRGQGYALFLTATEAVLTLKNHTQHETSATVPKIPYLSFSAHPLALDPPTVVRMQLVGANPTPHVVGTEILAGKANYFVGNDPAQWHTDIPTFRKVKYHAVYPGVDLVYYGKQRQLEYDFVVAPGAEPSEIRLSFIDQAGKAFPQTLDANGNLVLQTPRGEIRLVKPFVYQEENGTRKQIAGSYLLSPADSGTPTPSVSFQIAAYDTSKPLVIDPLVVYSTFLGGDRLDAAFALAVDENRNVYVAGQTLSSNFPLTETAADPVADVDAGDAFVVQLNHTGTQILYATYLGGAGADVARGLAIDSSGNAYITGETIAPDGANPSFPTTLGVVQPTAGGGSSDAFVTKLNNTGSTLLYSTYLGGPGFDRANAIAIDGLDNAYIAGQTLSEFFLPPLEPFTVFGDDPPGSSSEELPHDAFVVKLNRSATVRSYTTFFVGSAFEDATAIAVNAFGEAYVVGFTSSFDFPITPNAFQPGYSPTDVTSDAFVARLDATGTILRYSSYLGGGPGQNSTDPSPDAAFGVTIDTQGNAVVTGITGSPEFPVIGQAIQGGLVGTQDAFISIIDVGFSGQLLYSTYLGGDNVLQANAIVTDAPLRDGSYHVYIAGTTNSTIPVTTCAVQPLYGGGPSDAFITKIRVNLAESPEAELRYATYFGGAEKDEAHAFAIDDQRNMYLAGLTQSPSFFTTPDSAQPFFGGTQDAFVTKFDVLSHAPCADLKLTMTDDPDPIAVGNNITYTLTVTNLGPDIATNVMVTDTLPSDVTLLSATPSTGACTGTTTVTCSIGTLTLTQTATITIVAQALTAGAPINKASVTSSGPDLDVNNNDASVVTSVVAGTQLTVSITSETGSSGQITSRPPGIACPPDCTESYPPGTPVILTAEPEVGTSFFRNWSGACSGPTPFCAVTVNGVNGVGANFARASGLSAQWLDVTKICGGKPQKPKCKVTGTLRIFNPGPVRTGKSKTRFFFSADPTLSSGYVVLKEKKTPAIDAGSEHVIRITLRLPAGTNGTGHFVVAYVDADAQIAEVNEGNNRAVFGPLP